MDSLEEGISVSPRILHVVDFRMKTKWWQGNKWSFENIYPNGTIHLEYGTQPTSATNSQILKAPGIQFSGG